MILDLGKSAAVAEVMHLFVKEAALGKGKWERLPEVPGPPKPAFRTSIQLSSIRGE